MRRKLYEAVIAACVSYVVPKVIDLLSQLALFGIRLLLR